MFNDYDYDYDYDYIFEDENEDTMYLNEDRVEGECFYNSLKYIKYNDNKDMIPKHIKNLEIGRNPFYKSTFGCPCTYYYRFFSPINNLPTHIIKLEIISSCDSNINNLPKNILKIRLATLDTRPNNLSTIQHLNLSGKFNSKINNLPNSIEFLKLSKFFNIPCNNLPTKIKILIFDNQFKKNNYKEQEFCNFNFDFLPEGLEILKLNSQFKLKNKINDLPSSIKEIWIESDQINNINKMYHHKVNKYVIKQYYRY